MLTWRRKQRIPSSRSGVVGVLVWLALLLAGEPALAQDAGVRRDPFSAIVAPGEQMDLFVAHPLLLGFVVALVIVTVGLGIYTVRRALNDARQDRRR